MTINAMTAADFKSWLEGFMEGRAGRLTTKDVKTIQAKAASVYSGCGCHHYPYHPWSPFTYSTPAIWTGTTSVGNDATDISPTTTTFQLSAGAD